MRVERCNDSDADTLVPLSGAPMLAFRNECFDENTYAYLSMLAHSISPLMRLEQQDAHYHTRERKRAVILLGKLLENALRRRTSIEFDRFTSRAARIVRCIIVERQITMEKAIVCDRYHEETLNTLLDTLQPFALEYHRPGWVRTFPLTSVRVVIGRFRVQPHAVLYIPRPMNTGSIVLKEIIEYGA